MPSTPDLAARLRHAYERFAAGDSRDLAEFLAEDVVYHLPGRHLGGGTPRGRRLLFERAARAAVDCDAPPRLTIVDVIASGEIVVSLERLRGCRRGRTLDQDVAVVWRVARGKCVEMWAHFADQESCDRFWEGF